jgi:hypothetical protein
MAIKINYKFKGIEVPDATIRIIRVFGSSREGWSSLVGVYNTTIETIEAKEGTEFEPAIEASTKEVLNLLEEFNFNVEFSEDKRGYKSLYEGLMAKYGGIRVESK